MLYRLYFAIATLHTASSTSGWLIATVRRAQLPPQRPPGTFGALPYALPRSDGQSAARQRPPVAAMPRHTQPTTAAYSAIPLHSNR